MQRIEHYEIAAYGTDIALARALGERDVVKLLSETLEEEKQTDLKPTKVTEQHLMSEAMEGQKKDNPPSAGSSKGRSKAA